MFTLVALPLLLLYLLLYLLIVLVSLLGDHLLRLLPVQSTLLHLVIALSDTAIHGLISSCSWAMAVVVVLGILATNCDDQQSPRITSTNLFPFLQHLNVLSVLKDLLTCFLLAALIDVDHIFAAGSLNIAAMASLERRPVMHNTSLVLLISAAAFVSFHLFSYQISFCREEHFHLLWLHFLVASLTHHIRDGLRHGLYLWPLSPSSTAPVSLPFYFWFLLLFPLLVALLLVTFHFEDVCCGYWAQNDK